MRRVWAIAGVLAIAGCSGGDGAGPSASSTSSSTSPSLSFDEPQPVVVAELDPPAAGRARVVLGSALDVELAVQRCRVDLGALPEGEVPAERVSVVATGEATDGTSVTLELLRLASAGAAATITDTVRVTEGPADAPTRVLEAQRFEVRGVVTDPRDPEASGPLLTASGPTVEASGVFAPPGAFAADGGLVAGLVAVTCAA
jgi:hypothetical protein